MNYTKIFLEEANEYSEFNEAIEIVKKNSTGNIWMIGGFVYRNIISNLHGIKKPKIDLDFIVEKINENLTLPNNWIQGKSRMGSPKLIGPKYEIDIVPITNIYAINLFNLKPTIETFLSTTPLNIQSIVYDFEKNKIIGEKSIWSIENQLIIPTTNKEIIKNVELKKEINFHEYVKKYANELKFNFIIPKPF